MIVDSHCHLYFDAFDTDRDAVIERAKGYDIRWLVNVGTDPVANKASYELSKKYDCVRHTAGVHPHYSNQITETEWEELDAFIRDTKPRAIGEIGLDYFKSEADPETQKTVFRRALGLAQKYDLPVIVHSRSAFEDTFQILKEETGGKTKGVMHCFSYGKDELKKLLDFGFLASFTCNVTFKNAGPLLDVAKTVPLDRMMLETDSPYLAPQIWRGKRNEPSCLVHLSDFLAHERGIDANLLTETTSKTAIDFFRLEEPNA